MFLKGILWKQRLHQRTETRVCIFPGPDKLVSANLGFHFKNIFISDPLIVSKFHNETHDPKVQENKIYTILKGMETFYRRHTVPVTSCCEVKYVLKRGILWKQRLHQRTETRVCLQIQNGGFSIRRICFIQLEFRWIYLILIHFFKKGLSLFSKLSRYLEVELNASMT